MTLEELKEQLQLTDEQEELVKKFQQSAEDRVRTDYSKKLKDAQSELEKLKPIEIISALLLIILLLFTGSRAVFILAVFSNVLIIFFRKGKNGSITLS